MPGPTTQMPATPQKRPGTLRLDAFKPGATMRIEALQSRYEIHKKVAFGIYGVVSIASVAWALSGGGLGNRLGASVGVGSTGEGSVFVTVRNDSDFDWHHVTVEADGAYYLSVPVVAHGQGVDSPMSDFFNRYYLLRPTGMFLWESAALAAPPAERAPADYRPRRVKVACDEGDHERDTDD